MLPLQNHFPCSPSQLHVSPSTYLTAFPKPSKLSLLSYFSVKGRETSPGSFCHAETRVTLTLSFSLFHQFTSFKGDNTSNSKPELNDISYILPPHFFSAWTDLNISEIFAVFKETFVLSSRFKLCYSELQKMVFYCIKFLF